MKYIVLLRGINISGKNKISMNELKEELLKNNYTDVLTYLNSGNIILKSNKSEKDISDDVNKIIMNKFNIDIPVYVIKLEELIDVLNNNPSWWGINYKDIPAFSVQFHPEACGGPHDTNFLFDRFIQMCRK